MFGLGIGIRNELCLKYRKIHAMSITFTFDFEKLTQLAWTLHHDNAPAHTALSIRQLLAEKNNVHC